MAVKLGVKINIGNTRKQKLSIKLNQTTVNFGQVLINVKDKRLVGPTERILRAITPANAIIKVVR